MPGKREHSHEQRPTTYAIHDDDNLDEPHRAVIYVTLCVP
jgi:hypothetical protein